MISSLKLYDSIQMMEPKSAELEIMSMYSKSKDEYYKEINDDMLKDNVITLYCVRKDRKPCPVIGIELSE